jgi:hypothetical protein
METIAMKQNLLAVFFLLGLVSLVFSQSIQTSDTKPKSPKDPLNLLEKINLRFDLTGTPKPEDVGFNDTESSWKLKYELRLSNRKTIRDLQSNMYANCKDTNNNYRQKCVSKANQKLDKRYKKTALFISKGAFQKTSLLSESNRGIVIPLELTPEVISIFNRTAQSDENPTFILLIKSKVSAKTPTKTKVRFKNSISFEYPLKFYRKDGSFDFYNITNFGASIGINKEDNGKISNSIFKN